MGGGGESSFAHSMRAVSKVRQSPTNIKCAPCVISVIGFSQNGVNLNDTSKHSWQPTLDFLGPVSGS